MSFTPAPFRSDASAAHRRLCLILGGQRILLREGDSTVGRDAENTFRLDDPRVSRRHARFRVDERGVTVEDLGSVNGVFVNGERIDAPASLTVGDRIVIGDQELELARIGARPEQPTIHRLSEPSAEPAGEGEDRTSRVDTFVLLCSVADKALALGRAHEAERVLEGYLTGVLERATSGAQVDDVSAERAARYAVKLAGATKKGAWVDYAVSLWTALRSLPPGDLVDELIGMARTTDGVDLSGFRAYLADRRAAAEEMGAAERFLLRRLEGLERSLSA